MHDEGAQPDRATPPEVTDPVPPDPLAPPSAPGGPTAAAALSADLTAAWSKLDRNAQLLGGASIAAFVITLVGLPLGAWDSAQFALIVLAASAATAVTAWFGDTATARSLPIPLPTIEVAAAVVTTILAVLKVVEILFDLDQDGSIIALILAIPLAIAAGAMLLGATRRGGDLRAAVMRGDQGTKLAALGLILVLVGWALNLSVSFWTMGQAALPLAVLTVAALTIAFAPRIEAPFPVAWVGVAIGAFGAILALAHWGDLINLGATRVELGLIDFLGFLGYTAGAGLIIAGGVLSGLGQRTPGPEPTDGPIGAA